MAASNSLRRAALRARAMLEGKAEPPAWLEAYERFGVEDVRKGKAPKQLEFPEDRLYQAYLHKHPEFQQYPLDLNSESPSPMKLFVLTQAALMEKGHSRKTAYNMVEAEFSKALEGSSLSAGETALTAAQKQEEAVLQNALRERREIFGPPADLDLEPVSQPFSFRLPPRQPQQTAEPSSSQQQSQPTPLGFQPSTSDAPTQVTAATSRTQYDAGMQSQAEEQQSMEPMGGRQDREESAKPVSQQAQHAAPAGFVQFGVEPKRPVN